MRSWLLLRPKRPRNQSQTSIPTSKRRKRDGRQPGQRLGQQRHVAQTVHAIQSVRESIEVGELRPDEVMDQRDTAKSQGIDHAEGGDELQEATQDQQYEWRDDGAQHQAHTR